MIVLTQKDFYDFISKNGVEKFDQMMADLSNAATEAKNAYTADQKRKQEKMALDTKRINTLTDLLNDWFPADAFKMVSPQQMAESFYKVVEDYSKVEDKLLKAAKGVKVETKEVPGGTKTTIKGNLDPADARAAFEELTKEINKLFK